MSLPFLRRPGMIVLLCLLIAAASATVVVVTDGKDHSESDRAATVASRVRPELETALKEKGLSFGAPIYMRIFKESSELELWVQKQPEPKPEPEALERGTRSSSAIAATELPPEFELLRTYKICTWSGSLGPKQKQGDSQAPEGFYFVSRGRMNPDSRFHLAFDLGYPNAYDRAHKRTGKYLMVHGSCVSVGCYAMTNERIEEIYTLADAALNGGQKYFRVHCFPFRMSDERMAKAAEDEDEKQWLEFWENLREGDELFEKTKRPPNVEVEDGRYVFGE